MFRLAWFLYAFLRRHESRAVVVVALSALIGGVVLGSCIVDVFPNVEAHR